MRNESAGPAETREVTLDEDTMAMLKKLAKKDGRSPADEIVWLIERDLDRAKGKQPKLAKLQA